MKIHYAVISLAATLLIGSSLAVADNNDRSERQQREQRAEQRKQERLGNAERRAEFEARRASEEKANSPDQSKHANHLSADQRRALRQQINEAGQDIYGRRR